MTINAGILIGGAALGLTIAKGNKDEGIAPQMPTPSPQVPVARSSTTIAAQLAANNGTGPLLTGQATTTPIGSAGSPGSAQLGKGSTSTIPNPYITDGGGNYSKKVDQVVDQAIKDVEAEARKRYALLSKAAKKAGAEALNKQLDPSPNLTGDESFDEAGKKVGSTIGGAAAGAACASYAYTAAATPVCAWLGAVVGGYLGEHLGDWSKAAWSKVESWAGDAYDASKKVLKKIIPFW